MSVFRPHFERILSPQADTEGHFDSMHAADVLYTVANWAVQPEHGLVEQDATITPHEVSCALGALHNWKAGDHDDLKAEMIKSGGKPLVTAIKALLNAVWTAEHVPHVWKLGTIVSLHQSGDTSDIANYRGITLVSMFRKVLSTILRNRLAAGVPLHE